MKLKSVLHIMLSLLTLVIVGCGGGGGGGSSTTTVTGKAVKGPIAGATVQVYAVNADGSVNFTTPLPTTPAIPLTKAPFGNYSATFNYAGPVVVQVSGGSYTDEATGNTVDPAGTFRAAVANAAGTTTVNVTPLTEIAVKNLLASAQAFNATNINQANTGVANAMGLTGQNVTTASPTDDPYYKFLLGVVSQAAVTGGSTPTAVDDFLVQMAVGINAAAGTISGPARTDFTAASNAVFTNGNIDTSVIDRNAPRTITLTATPSTGFTTSGTSVAISAFVTSAGGIVPDGTAVTFTSNAGTLSAITTTTNGVATASLSSSAEGTVVVSAQAGTVTSGINVPFFVDPNVPATVTVTANPASVFAGQTAVISAAVTRAAGGPVPDGTTVNFTFTSSAGTTNASFTTTNGVATANMTSDIVGSVAVTATAGTVTGNANVPVLDPNAPATVTVTANPASVLRGQTTLVSATVTRAAGGAVPNGTTVNFTFSSPGGNTVASSTTTNGVATANLTSSVVGNVTVAAQVGSISGSATIPVGTNPDDPAAIAVTANPATLFTGQSTTISATVTRLGGGAVPNGTVVTFSAPNGTLSGITTTTNGVATANLTSNVAGSVTVTAAAGTAPTVTGTRSVPFTDPDAPATIAVTANPATLFIGQTTAISATVIRAAGGPVPNGTVVTFTAPNGTLSAITTTTNGIATANLTSNVVGSVTVTAQAGTVTGSTTVPFANPNLPGSIALVASPTSGVTNNQTPVTLTATVTPAGPGGVIANGSTVTFTIITGTGTLSSATATTNNGVASVTLNSNVADSITVNATSGSATSNVVTVPFVSQPTVAIVKVATSGTLPNGTLIGGIQTSVTANPTSGLTIAASDVVASGAGAGNLLQPNANSVASVVLGLISTSGIQAGEFATLTYHIAAGNFPVAGNFGIAGGATIIDTAGVTIPGMSITIQSVTIQ